MGPSLMLLEVRWGAKSVPIAPVGFPNLGFDARLGEAARADRKSLVFCCVEGGWACIGLTVAVSAAMRARRRSGSLRRAWFLSRLG